MRDVLLVVWATRATREAVLKLESEARKRIDEFKVSATIHVAVPGALLPDESGRRALEEITSRLASQTSAVAVVLMGHGFWASAVRAFVTSVRWSGGVSFPFKLQICSTLEEATGWLVTQHTKNAGITPDATELNAALRTLLAHPDVATSTET